jgi:ferredoxin
MSEENSRCTALMKKRKGSDTLKASIDRDGCIGCGLCAGTCPEVFEMAADGLADVISETVPAGAEDSAIEAKDGCPVSVITVE